MTSGATVLITGGAGFLGSHLCDRLLADGARVICVDSLLTGTLANLRKVEGDPKFTFVQQDISNPIDVDEGVDLILHFASPASPKDYARHPIHTLKVGALGTYHALGLAKAKSARFVLASSSEVYGDPQVSPQPETYWGHVNPVGIRSVYDEAKRFAEAITVAYHRAHGIDVRIARIFNTYGPRMRLEDGRAMPTFIAQALRNEALTVYGDGWQTRSFCYVDDLVDGVVRLAMAPPTAGLLQHEDLPGVMICNLGNPEEVTIMQLAREIIAATGSASVISHAPLPPDDPRVRRPEISRARLLLGWDPKVPRSEGLARTIGYFRDRLRLGVS